MEPRDSPLSLQSAPARSATDPVNLGGTTEETPAPQGVGVFLCIEEVIVMTDDETETCRTLCAITHFYVS